MNQIQRRFDHMLQRLAETYDGIGHSSGRPFLYFVYAPDKEQFVLRLAEELMGSAGELLFIHIDMVQLTIDSLAGQEERRATLLNDPVSGSSAGVSIVRLWARRLQRRIDQLLADSPADKRPVIVLRGLASLHPLGNPTSLMEAVAEQEPRHPITGKAVPVVLLVPGVTPPGSSRTYDFLGLADQRLSFYRGEEL